MVMPKIAFTGDTGDYTVDDTGKLTRRNGGLSWVIASFFIVADLSGSGIVALPKTIAVTGYWFGMASLLFVTIVMLTSGLLLGKSWNIMLRNYPVYRSHCRKPYAEMGYRVGGMPMRIFSSVCMLLTNFGASVVFLILCGKNINDFAVAVFEREPGQCLMIGVIAICILPITLFKSPQNFSGIITIGMSATIFAMASICIGTLLDLSTCTTRKFGDIQGEHVWIMLGTLLFSYGGHGTFPTVQHDMRRPSEFSRSSYLAFTIVFLLYGSVAAIGAWTYGDSVGDSIINSIQTKPIQQAINLLIMMHCFLTTTLILNPVNQEMEEFLHVPHDSVVKRIIARSLTMLLVTLTALLLPTFNLILGVIGGSTIMFTSVFFPAVYYLFLSAEEKPSTTFVSGNDKNLMAKNWRKILHPSNASSLCMCLCIIIFGLIAGAAATYTSLVALVSSSGMKSCFWSSPNWEAEDDPLTLSCGAFHNLSSANMN